MKLRLAVFFSVFFVAGLTFWACCGYELSYNVYSGDEHWYSEEFSITGKIFVTILIALICSLLVPFLADLLMGWMRKFSCSFSIYKDVKK